MPWFTRKIATKLTIPPDHPSEIRRELELGCRSGRLPCPATLFVVAVGARSLSIRIVRLRYDADGCLTSEQLASSAAQFGSDDVDQALLSRLCEEHGYPLFDLRAREARSWTPLMLEETSAVRRRAMVDDSPEFRVTPPEEIRDFEARLRGPAPLFELGRARITAQLEAQGFERDLRHACQAALRRLASAKGGNEVDAIVQLGEPIPGLAAWLEQWVPQRPPQLTRTPRPSSPLDGHTPSSRNAVVVASFVGVVSLILLTTLFAVTSLVWMLLTVPASLLLVPLCILAHAAGAVPASPEDDGPRAPRQASTSGAARASQVWERGLP